jgi:hypothetical protein
MIPGWKVLFLGMLTGIMIVPICVFGIRGDWTGVIVCGTIATVSFWFGGKTAETLLWPARFYKNERGFFVSKNPYEVENQ